MRFFECPICLEHFTDPIRALPCHHLFCKKCLKDWQKTEGEKICSTCRRVVVKQEKANFDSFKHGIDELDRILESAKQLEKEPKMIIDTV